MRTNCRCCAANADVENNGGNNVEEEPNPGNVDLEEVNDEAGVEAGEEPAPVTNTYY